MTFTQVVEFRTSRIDELNSYFDAWIDRTDGQRVPHQARLFRVRDTGGTDYQLVVEFASHDAAVDNSGRPATGEFAAFLASICERPPTFRSLDALRDDRL